jgi:hypothetical protein
VGAYAPELGDAQASDPLGSSAIPSLGLNL